MDERLARALENSKLRYTLSLERRRLTEKLRSDLTYSINGGTFYIDRNLIVFLNLITPEEGQMSVTLLDDNMTPVYIPDVKKLQTDVLDVYTKAVNQYYADFEVIRKKRSVAKLIEL